MRIWMFPFCRNTNEKSPHHPDCHHSILSPFHRREINRESDNSSIWRQKRRATSWPLQHRQKRVTKFLHARPAFLLVSNSVSSQMWRGFPGFSLLITTRKWPLEPSEPSEHNCPALKGERLGSFQDGLTMLVSGSWMCFHLATRERWGLYWCNSLFIKISSFHHFFLNNYFIFCQIVPFQLLLFPPLLLLELLVWGSACYILGCLFYLLSNCSISVVVVSTIVAVESASVGVCKV